MGVARPTDQEATAIEKTVYNSWITREWGTPSHTGHTGRHQGRQEAEGDREPWARAFIVVSTVKERNGQGRVSRLRSASSNNFSGFWGMGAAPGCVAPGLGIVRAGIAAQGVRAQ